MKSRTAPSAAASSSEGAASTNERAHSAGRLMYIASGQAESASRPARCNARLTARVSEAPPSSNTALIRCGRWLNLFVARQRTREPRGVAGWIRRSTAALARGINASSAVGSAPARARGRLWLFPRARQGVRLQDTPAAVAPARPGAAGPCGRRPGTAGSNRAGSSRAGSSRAEAGGRSRSKNNSATRVGRRRARRSLFAGSRPHRTRAGSRP